MWVQNMHPHSPAFTCHAKKLMPLAEVLKEVLALARSMIWQCLSGHWAALVLPQSCG